VANRGESKKRGAGREAECLEHIALAKREKREQAAAGQENGVSQRGERPGRKSEDHNRGERCPERSGR